MDIIELIEKESKYSLDDYKQLSDLIQNEINKENHSTSYFKELKLDKKEFIINNKSYSIYKFSNICIQTILEIKKINLSSNFDEVLSFYHEIIIILKQIKISTFRIKDEILQILILKSLKSNNDDLNIFIKSIQKDNLNEYVFLFIKNYFLIISQSKFPIDYNIIFINSLTLLNVTHREDVTYNSTSSLILNSLLVKCNKSNYKFTIALFNISLNYKGFLEEHNKSILSILIISLYKFKGLSFYKEYLIPLLKDSKYQKTVINGLVNIDIEKKEDFDLIINLNNKYSDNEDLLLILSKGLFSIVKTNNLDYKKTAFEEITKSIKNEILTQYIINELTYLEGNEQERIDLIIKIIEEPYYSSDKYASQISDILYYIKDIKFLKSILNSISKKNEFNSICHYFKNHILTFSAEEVDYIIIEYITDSKASKRYIGTDIFFNLSYKIPYKFTINISKTKPITQYKIWVTLLNSFQEPKYSIPSLIPLINSESEIIKESFICKIEELVEDYDDSVILCLKENININKNNHILFLERVVNHLHNFKTNKINPKEGIKELNPLENENKFINQYYFLHKKNNKEKYDNVENNSSSFLNHLTTIVLAKGGGWKTNNSDKITELSKFEVSFRLSRSSMTNPLFYELEKSKDIFSDWQETDFKEVIELLENE